MKPSNTALAQPRNPETGGGTQLDDKTFVAVIPSYEGMTDFERAAVDAGHRPVRLVFASAEQAARAAASTVKPPKFRQRLPEPPATAAPSIESVLQAVVRNAVRDEVRAALNELPQLPPPAPTPTPGINERLTVEAIARELNVTCGTVREWIKAGDLKANRVGPEGKARIYSISRADLEEFLHRRRVNPVVHDIDTQADEILQTLNVDETGRG
jgi:excisionase family DNA binding protein